MANDHDNAISKHFSNLKDPRWYNKRHKILEIKDSIVTIDAMGCQKTIAETIVKKGRRCFFLET